MNNVMLDLETYGTQPGSAIRSVGAVMFDPHSDKIGAEFYYNVLDASCEAAGLTRDQSTIDWWNQPKNKKAQDSLAKDQRNLLFVLMEFSSWFRKNRGIFVWSQGANFDEPLLACAYRAEKIREPWKFSDARDTRTAYDISGFNSYAVKRAGTYHNALDDAKHQALCVQHSYARVAGRLL